MRSELPAWHSAVGNHQIISSSCTLSFPTWYLVIPPSPYHTSSPVTMRAGGPCGWIHICLIAGDVFLCLSVSFSVASEQLFTFHPVIPSILPPARLCHFNRHSLSVCACQSFPISLILSLLMLLFFLLRWVLIFFPLNPFSVFSSLLCYLVQIKQHIIVKTGLHMDTRHYKNPFFIFRPQCCPYCCFYSAIFRSVWMV